MGEKTGVSVFDAVPCLMRFFICFVSFFFSDHKGVGVALAVVRLLRCFGTFWSFDELGFLGVLMYTFDDFVPSTNFGL